MRRVPSGLAVVVIASAATVASSAEIAVPGDYPSLPEAIAAAMDGDTIVVANSSFLSNLGKLDLRTKQLRIETPGTFSCFDTSFILDDGDELVSVNGGLIVNGLIQVANGATATLSTPQEINLGNDIDVCVEVDTGAELRFESDNAVVFSGHLIVREDGVADVRTSVFEQSYCYAGFTLRSGSRLTTSGPLVIEVFEGSAIATEAAIEANELVVQGGPLVMTGGSLTVTDQVQFVGGARLISDGTDLTLLRSAGVQFNQGGHAISDCTVITGDELSFNAPLMPTVFRRVEYFGDRLDFDGTLAASGYWASGVFNAGSWLVPESTTVIGEVDNSGFIYVQNGTLTCFSGLNNNGSIIGDFQSPQDAPDGEDDADGPTVPGSGLSVSGNLTVSGEGSLLFDEPVWELELTGNLDLLIPSSQVALSGATVRMGDPGSPTRPARLESFAADLGPTPQGFLAGAPGRSPIGRLEVRGLVGVADKLPFSEVDAVYVRTLVFEPGGRLSVVGGTTLYYATLEGTPTILTPEFVVQVSDDEVCNAADLAAPFGVMNFADVQTFLGSFNATLPIADLAAPSGTFNFADVQSFIGLFLQGCE